MKQPGAEKSSCKKAPWPALVIFEFLLLLNEKTFFPFIGYHPACSLQ